MTNSYKYLRLLPILLLGLSMSGFAQTSVFSYVPGTIQTYVVPPGVFGINVTSKGAQGGGNTIGGAQGGLGAVLVGDFAVTPGDVLNVVVGGRGATASRVGGGGGASYVWNNGSGTLLQAAGAGGGAGYNNTPLSDNGVDASLTTSGTNGRGVLSGAGTAGTGATQPGGYTYWAGGGAGWFSDGNNGSVFGPCSFVCTGGKTPGGGAIGGTGGGNPGSNADGGFGGGGGGNGRCTALGGGGGGGYSGGGAGAESGAGGSPAGGGGGSFNGGTFQVNTVGNTGDGEVTITLACVPPTAGAIVSSPNLCIATSYTFTNPTGTPGGTWSSSATAVATVGSTTGLVSGIATGTAVISYSINLSCGSAVATRTVTVVNTPSPIVGPFSVCSTVLPMPAPTISLTAPTPTGTWTSVTPGVAGVDPVTGVVTGVAVGTSVISYSIAGCGTVTATVTVIPTPLPIVGPSTIQGCKRESLTLVDPTPGGTWTSSIPIVGTITPLTGIITGINVGFTNVTYTAPNGCFTSKFVRINEPPAPITGPSSVCEGFAVTLANIIPAGTWSSSLPAIASIGSTAGNFNGVTAGVSVISYSIAGCRPATFNLTVNPPPAPITGMTSICIGVATSLANASTGGFWSSSDTTVATIDPFGVLTTISYVIGSSTMVTYTLPTGCYATVPVTVNASPAPITGPDSVCKGSQVTLASVTPGGIWSSSDLSLAQVIDTNGQVTGVNSGVVAISYTLSTGCYQSKVFVVENPVAAIATITSTPGDSVCAGTPIRFDVTATNGGVPSFQWQLFYTGTSLSTDTFFNYVATTHGDVIVCRMITSGICVIQDTVYDTVRVNVYPNVRPNVIIRHAEPDNSIDYLGQIFTFYSDVTYGGRGATYQWYVNNTPVAGATGITFTKAVYANSLIYCVVTGNPPCMIPPSKDTSNKILILADFVNVQQVATTRAISLFPNPNTGSFTLAGTTGNNNGVINYEVTNMVGQVVYKGTTTAQNGAVHEEININNLAAGNYLLHAASETMNEVFHFVVNR